MRQLFRPSLVLFALLLTAVLVTGAVLLWPRDDRHPHPEPVPRGDHEIVWLSFASNYSTWERFIKGIDTAVKRLAKDPAAPKLEVDLDRAYPLESTAVPEVVLSVEGVSGKLRIRWYKQTGNWRTHDWVEALMARNPPPIAIIGGSFSDAAITAARELADQATSLGGRAPLFFVTQATKTYLVKKINQAGEAPPDVPYRDRTFRFCFTNSRLTASVCDFIWGSDVLRPTCGECYIPYWEDDRYSEDLREAFKDTVKIRSSLYPILTSVGTFDRPNREESQWASQLMDDLTKQPDSCRPLLVLSGQLQPSRRFLRALARLDPNVIPRLVATTGDAVSFNTIYRDRNVAWPIQDFPCDLILFAHRNPVAGDAGFQRVARGAEQGMGSGPGSTGTEDVLLYADMIEALTFTAFHDKKLVADADEMREQLRQMRWNRHDEQVCLDQQQPLLFAENGDRAPGTGECIIWLQPKQSRGVVLPEGALRVYHHARETGGEPWTSFWEDTELPFEGAAKPH